MRKIADFKKSAENIASEWAVPFFAFFLILLFVALVSVMFSGCAAEWVGDLFGSNGNNSKTATIQLLGWIMSGMLAVIGLVFLNRRAEAQIRAAEAQTDVAKSQAENNKLIEKGHTQERFKTAAEHLGHNNVSVRIAAFYEFVHLANEHKEEYQKSILGILYAYVRIVTTDFANSEYVKNAQAQGNLGKYVEPIKPTEEIQGLLDILFKFQDIERSDIKLNLQRVCFSGVDLTKGDLSKANLSKANLSKAWLYGVILSEANLNEANLFGANLSEANLSEADLSETNLSGAKMSGANLSKSDLSKANLSEAYLYGADLSEANLSEANLSRVDLSKANLSGANLSKAYFFRADVPKYLLGYELSGDELSGYAFSFLGFIEIQLGGAYYTNTTQFPEWFEPPIAPPDNGDKVQFPEGFVAPKKPKEPEVMNRVF